MAISKDNVRIATTISKEIAEIITKLAEKERRTVSVMTAILIEKGLDSYKK